MDAKEAKKLTQKFFMNKFFEQYNDVFDKIKEAANTGAYYVVLRNQSGKIADFEKFKILMREYFNYAVAVKVESEDTATTECKATLVIDWEKA